MNYTIESGTYIANEGYCFVNRSNGATGTIMHLAEGDYIGNYDCIEKPVEYESPEEPTEEISYEQAYNELTEVLGDE